MPWRPAARLPSRSRLDKHFAVLNEHKENYTVAPLLLTHAPRLCHALCVIGDIRVALHLGKTATTTGRKFPARIEQAAR